jgi:hypothetical protein
MAMGTRKQREKQEDIWIAHTELPSAPGHPFYQRLNELLEAEKFDESMEGRCAKSYAAKYGRPSLPRGSASGRCCWATAAGNYCGVKGTLRLPPTGELSLELSARFGALHAQSDRMRNFLKARKKTIDRLGITPRASIKFHLRKMLLNHHAG